jgi:hypothetical protein
MGEIGMVGAGGEGIVLLFFELCDDIGHAMIRSDLFNGAFRREYPDRPVLFARSCVTLLAGPKPQASGRIVEVCRRVQ